MTKNLLIWNCQKCKHKWVNRNERTPKMCPKCKSVNWEYDARCLYCNKKTKGKTSTSKNEFCSNECTANYYENLDK